jgi:hypothetical protein
LSQWVLRLEHWEVKVKSKMIFYYCLVRSDLFGIREMFWTR